MNNSITKKESSNAIADLSRNLGIKKFYTFKNVILTALLAIIGSGAWAQSFTTPTFTGAIGDFAAGDRFAAAANNTTYAITFDATYMYFGAFRTTGSFGSGDNFAIYLDTDPRNTLASGNGTTAGRNFNSVTPTLPFNADYTSITEQSYTDPINRYNGIWASTGVTPTVFTSTTCREVRIALSDIGNPASVYVSVWMGYNGGIYSSAPGTDVTASGTPAITGYFGSFPVYKSGINPISFRAQNTTTASGGGTAISNLTVTPTTAITAGDYGDITITNTAGTSSISGNTSFTGTLTIGSGTTNATRLGLSTFSLFVGGRGVGGTAGQISVNGSSGTPITNGGASTIAFLGAGIVSGASTAASMVVFPSSTTVTIAGAVDFGSVGTTTPSGLAGTLQINSGGFVNTNPPTYNSGSTLVYNTGGTYTAGSEWTTNSAGAKGVPQAVTLQNNTAVNFGSSALYRQANGLVTIGSGSGLTLSSASGGDLRIAGGLTNNNAGTGVGVNTNGRAIQTMGTGTYTKAGTDNLDFLIIGSSNTLTLASGTNLSLTNTNASGCLQFTNLLGTIFMGGTNTISIVAGGTVGGTTAGSIGGSAPTTTILSLLGACTWSPGGVITVSTNVGIQVNAGLSITTATRLNAGYVQINQGGFVSTNPIVYATNSTLSYNHSSGTYGVGANEWPAASGPYNLIVNNNGSSTGISFATNGIGTRTIPSTGTNGTVTLNQDIDLSGAGPAQLTISGIAATGLIANATAVVKGTGTILFSSSASMSTANVLGVNGTLTCTTKTFNTNNNFTFNAIASQVTGALMPTTIGALTINNSAGGTNGVTISSNTLVIGTTTTLTLGALILPTAASNLVTFTGNISTPTSGGTITGSTASNIATSGTVAGTGTGVVFTTGSQNIRNWTCNAVFGSLTTGLNSNLTVNGIFQFPTNTPDLFTNSGFTMTFVSGSTFDQNFISGARLLGAGNYNFQSGSNLLIGATSGLYASTPNGAVQNTGSRTFSGGANYTFNNASSAQAIGTALDVTGGTGQTGIITGNVVINNNTVSGVTLNAGTTITVNTPGVFNIGVSGTSSGTVTAPASSIINGSGNVNMFGNGAINGSTLVTANASGVNGTFAGSGTITLNNVGNNNTNFTFNGAVVQSVGSLLPATINNLSISNTTASATPTADVNLSSSVTVNGAFTNSGRLGIGSNTLTLNGAITFTANKLAPTSSSNLIIGGSGSITGVSPFVTGGVSLNNFTMNRASTTFTGNSAMTVGGTYSLSNGIHSLGAGLILNGAISFGSGTLTGGTNPLTIGGFGTITGSLTATASPLALTSITMSRASSTLSLGSNVTVSIATGLTLTAGNIALGTFNLTNTNNAGTLGIGSASSMIVATSTGQAFLTAPTGGSTQLFPIGDGTNYTPVSLVFTANAVSGTIGGRVTASAHPQLNLTGNPQADYLNRYWSFTTTSLTTYTYTGTFTYVAGDIVGTQTNMKLNRYNGTLWAEDATSTAASNVLTSTTGLTQATGPLNNNAFTGRKEPSAVNYTWNGVTNDWATATNWSPNGNPSAVDNVTIDGSLSAVLCKINSSSYSVNNFTLNGTGAFEMTASTTLTTNGAITYGGTATAVFDCASTFKINSTSSQPVPALNYGGLDISLGNRTLASSGTIGICGAYTPGAGVITITGSTVNFNGTGAQAINAVNYNNLTISNARSGANNITLANSGTIGIAGTFSPTATFGTGAYVITSSTIDYNGTGAQSIGSFNNNGNNTGYNNLTISGARGAATVTLSSGTISVTGIFNPSASAVTYAHNSGTFDFVSTASQTIPVFDKYNNLNNSANGARTLANGIIKIDGLYSPTTATVTIGTSTIDFSSASTQTMPATSYYAVTNSGNGNRTWASSGITDINFTFAQSTAINTINGSTIRYSSTTSTTHTLSNFTTEFTSPARNYFNLILVGGASTIWTPGVGFNLGVKNDFSLIGSGTLNICSNATANTMSVDGNFLLGTGSGNVNVASSSGAGTLNVTGNLTHSGTGFFTVTGSTGIGALAITGNMSLSGTAGTLRVTNNGSAPNTTITVGGDLSISNTGRIQMEATSTASTTSVINVAGNFSSTATGTFSSSSVDWGAGSANSTLSGNNITVMGNFSKSGVGTFYTTGGTTGVAPTNFGFIFNKTGTQTFSYAGAVSDYTCYTINATSTLQLTTDFAMGVNTSAPQTTFIVNGIYDMQTFKMTGMSASSNAVFTLASGATLKTANTLGVNDGTASSSLGGLSTLVVKTYNTAANYEFNGTAAQNTNFPAAVTNMNNLTINNSTANVKINKSINVNGNLILTSGNLDLNGSFNVSLGSSSLIQNETSAKRVINSGAPTATNGFIGGIFTLLANPGNVANLGMNITTASAMGSTIIQRFPKIVTSIPTSLNSINRVYAIQATTASANSTIVLNYFDGELNGNTETSPSMVTYSSTGANETVAANYAFTGASATDGTANTVTYNVANLTTTNTFWTVLNADKYSTAQDGDWATGSTWVGGAVPPANANIVINHIVTVNTASPLNVGDLSINGSKSLTISAAYTLTINTGKTLTNNGVASLGTGTITFAGTGTVAGTTTFGNVNISGGVNFGTASTIAGTLRINTGGFVNTNAPIYGASSTLRYATGTTYGRSLEWGATGAGTIGTTPGYPNNVYIANATTLNLENGTPGTARQCNGSLTLAENVGLSTGALSMGAMIQPLTVLGNVLIGTGFANGTLTLSSVSGGDIKINGNMFLSGGGTSTFNANGRAVSFEGTSSSTIGMDNELLSILINNKSTPANIISAGIAFDNTGGNFLQLIGGGLDLNGTNINFTSSSAGNIVVTGARSIIGGSGSNFVNVSGGTKTITGTGTLNFGNSTNLKMNLSGGIDFGNNITTFSSTTSLQINGGGFVTGNAPIYASGSTLQYSSGSNYGRGVEWSATSGAGYPYNVTIQLNGTPTTLDLSNGGSANRACAGNLTLNNGGILNMGAMPNTLEVKGNTTIGGGASGSLILSSAAGGDFITGGNLTLNGGTFTQNGREVTLNGISGNQDVTGIITFAYLKISNSGTSARILATTTVSNRLWLNTGTFNLNGFGLQLSNGALVRRSISGATMSAAPTFLGAYDLEYNATMTTGVEFPNGIVESRDLSITAGTLTLNGNKRIGQNLNLSGGDLNLGGFTFTDFGNIASPSFAGVIEVSNGGTRHITGTGTFDITGTGGNSPTLYTKTVSTLGGTSLNFDSNVLVRIGDGSVDFGAGNPTTIDGVLQVLLGGSVGQILNPCNYGTNSILRFANTIDYQVGTNDKTWATGAINSGNAGIPYNVEVNDAGTDLQLQSTRALRGNLTISTGTFTLTPSFAGDFNIGGNWTNASGSFFHNSKKVIFDRQTAGNQTIIGTETFYDLEVSLNSGSLVLSTATNVTISNDLSFTGGKLDIGTATNNITVNGAITGAGSSNYINTNYAGAGALIRKAATNTTYVFPVGDATNYTPISLTLYSGANASSTLKGKVVDAVQPNLASSSPTPPTEYLTRYWSMDESGLTPGFGYGIDATFVNTGSDITGSVSNIFPYKYHAGVGVGAGWVAAAIANSAYPMGTGSVSAGHIIWDGLYSFSDITGGGNGTPQPITLLNFDVKANGNQVNLDWRTASEINNDRFELQRSTDAKAWETFTTQKGAGNHNGILNYSAVDNQPYNGVSYYRLKQIDFDGKFDFSEIKSVSIDKAIDATITINMYPNPATGGNVNVTLSNININSRIQIVVKDLLGKNLITVANDIAASTYFSTSVNADNLSNGVYLIAITIDGVTTTKKLVVRK